MKNYPFIATRIQWNVSFCFSWLSSSSDVCLKSFVQLGLLNCPSLKTVDDLKEVAASTRTARVVEIREETGQGEGCIGGLRGRPQSRRDSHARYICGVS